jgi:hypothetical protein
MSNVNERLVSEMAHALMKRVLRSEIRDEYEEKIANERLHLLPPRKY